jgi:hypothetical protein
MAHIHITLGSQITMANIYITLGSQITMSKYLHNIRIPNYHEKIFT